MVTACHTLSEAELRKTFAHFPAGVAAIAGHVNGTAHVLVVSSFSVGVSLDPPLVAFSVQRESSTWPLLREAHRLGVSVLSASQGGLCRQLAHRDKDKRWVDVQIDHKSSDAVLIEQAAIELECSIYSVHDAGDHEMVLLKVEALNAATDLEPLIFHGSQFRALEAVL